MTGTEEDQQQTLEPQVKLRGACTDDAQEVCEDAGKLGLPQAIDQTKRLC